MAHRRLHVRRWRAARRSAGARERRTGSDERPGPHRCPGSRVASRRRRAVGWRRKRRAHLGLHCSVELCPREHAIMIGIQGVEQRSWSRLTLGQWRRPMSRSRCSHRPTDRRRLCLPSFRWHLLCNHRRFGWRTLPVLPWTCDNSSHCLLGWLPLVWGLGLVRHLLLWLLLLIWCLGRPGHQRALRGLMLKLPRGNCMRRGIHAHRSQSVSGWYRRRGGARVAHVHVALRSRGRRRPVRSVWQ
mmetsp:Transcript_72902/g.236938  ORF Transcript_72902/g.236938 Transcript_72902/m.236938 type:complete len:243 (+) Transcript_72902:432-1160(+)